MSILEELIQSADNLCNSLEKASQNEKKFCLDVCIQLERMNLDTKKLKNNLNYIKDSL